MSILTQFPESVYPKDLPKLETQATEFNPNNAIAMAWAAQLAYEVDDPEKLETILANWGWKLLGYHRGKISSVLPLTSAKGFIASCGDVAILTFSGTEPLSIADWVVDFSIHRSADGVHAGFNEGVNIVWPTISALLAAGGTAGNGKVFITGHSLGGALAVVAAHRLTSDPIVVAPGRLLGVYTFGQPRVGDETFAAAYRTVVGLAERTWRLVDGLDIVPQIPPSETPFAFRHFGCSLHCARGTSFTTVPVAADAPELVPPGTSALFALARAALRSEAAPNGEPPFPGHPLARVVIDSLAPAFRDHMMDRYLRALQGSRSTFV
jgi:triacylglycerol lipase